jgi:hypothetical protein
MMKVKAKTAFFHGKQLCKKGDVIEIEPSEFNGINMIQIEEEAEIEDTKPAKTYTGKTTTKKTSNKKSK